MRKGILALAVLLFATGVGSLALTLYLWLGDWPQALRPALETARSVAALAGRPPPPLLAHWPGRTRVPLGGTWQAVVDPISVGEWRGLETLIASDPRPRSPSDHMEFAFDGGLALRVPGDWNTQDPRLLFYEGLVWYQREFDHARRPGTRVFLACGAANYRARFYLNGLMVGEHVGGFTPFNFEVTHALRDGTNRIVAKVDNQLSEHDVPVRRNDWLNYGGLTREVELLEVPETFVRGYHVQLARGERERIRGWVQLDGPRAAQRVVVSIPELGAGATVATDASGRAELDFPARPALWSPASPRLYAVEIAAETDSVREEIGFRVIERRGTQILLNGEPLYLRGISLHEEAPDGQGRAWSPEHAATLLGWAQELGANFVRLAHYPHADHVARLADRLGLLVWAEIPVYWTLAFESPETLALAKQQLSELVARDRNRASVVFWSIGNETPVGEARNAFMQGLAEHARREDDTRLVAAALETPMAEAVKMLASHAIPAAAGIVRDEWVLEVSDPLAEMVDVPGLNEYFGWYYETPLSFATPLSAHTLRRISLENLPRLRLRLGVERPVLLSEFGADALAGFHAPESELAVFSEEYQALVFRQQLAMLEHQPAVRGVSPWLLKDFRSPIRLHQAMQGYWNRKGLVADDGRRKLAFSVLRDHYRARAAAGG